MTDEARWWRASYWVGETDARPLALLRIALATVVLVVLAERSVDLRELFTDEGIFPRAAREVHHVVDLYGLSGGVGFTATMFALTAVFAVLLGLGWRTRLVTPIVWVLVVSQQWRNPLLLHGGDALLRHLLLWASFSDWGAAYSLDAGRGRGALRVWALPVRLLQLQLVAVYLATGIHKLGASEWVDGSALYYVLHSRNFVRTTSVWLVGWPTLCRFFTWSTLLIELAQPILFFVPVGPAGKRRARSLFLLLGLVLHLVILVVMRLSLSWLTISAAYAVAVPASWLPDARIPVSRGRAWRLNRKLLALVLAPAVFVAVASSADSFSLRVLPGMTLQLGLWQRWTMFSPPSHFSGRWRAIGTLVDGTTLDVLPDAAPELSERGGFCYRSWYQFRLLLTANPIEGVSQWVCRRWNALSNRPRLVSLEWQMAAEGTPPPDGSPAPPPHIDPWGGPQSCAR